MPGSRGTLVVRSEAVLVVIDVQDRLADVMALRDEVVSRAGMLVAVAAELGVPIIATRQYPKGLGEIVGELGVALDEARASGADVRVIDKVVFSCPDDPIFAAALADIGASHAILAGMETHICVAQTALALAQGGSVAHVVADATCSQHGADRDVALERLRSAGVDVTCAESVTYELLGRAATDEFRAVLAIVKGA